MCLLRRHCLSRPPFGAVCRVPADPSQTPEPPLLSSLAPSSPPPSSGFATLPIVRSVADLRTHIAGWGASRVALVPTMGALHAGHLALVAAARAAGATRVVASLFVNPRQFGPTEDLARYPRDEAADAAALTTAGCDLLFAPSVAAMYPPGFATSIVVAELGDVLDGAARPSHFDGVAIVVAKLLLAAGPALAVFGEKDWQQLAIIRRLVADLALPVEIVGAAIVRDPDGLALSSRNVYLTAAERIGALALPRALAAARDAIQSGAPVAGVLAEAEAAITAAGFTPPDYVALVDADLQPVASLVGPARLLAAARIGTTRLIDNLAVG
jgi:pantoate--beta-alanine ligase